ncbi:hypothetical protein GCK32_008974 [Trichostrongylus colubriformis]|uniref:Uncharacterized protein n=1 Tax=Trichostrongylus colubriformis TaxID=6319 RepID=A0AAN8EWL3_TRICO
MNHSDQGQDPVEKFDGVLLWVGRGLLPCDWTLHARTVGTEALHQHWNTFGICCCGSRFIRRKITSFVNRNNHVGGQGYDLVTCCWRRSDPETEEI